MKNYIQNIVEESLKDEVDVDKEWKRLLPFLNNQKIPMRVTGRKRVLPWMVRYAAAFLFGILFSFSAFYLSDKKGMQEIGTYKITTYKGEKSYLQLPDGTKVWLNSCTTLEYAGDYGRANRDLFLNGEAYFEVAKNKDLPFVVKTSGVSVEALGTVFNVCAYAEDVQLMTTLFRGSVAVRPNKAKQQVLLEPNQVAVYYKNKNQIQVVPYDKKQFAQWKDGFLSFERMSLQEITKLLERNYNVVFLFDNQEIKKFRFSGSFRNSEDLSEILNVIKTNTGMQYKIRKDTIVIK